MDRFSLLSGISDVLYSPYDRAAEELFPPRRTNKGDIMKHHLLTRVVWTIAYCSVLWSGIAIASISEPDCASLQQWAGSLTPKATFEPRPGIKVNTLFEDKRVVPVFGSPLLAWSRQDVSSAQSWLANCRKQALAAKDRDTGKTLYAALKELKLVSRSMRSVWSAQRMVEQQVTNLLKLNPSPDSLEVLAIAQKALRGEEIGNRVSSLPPQWQGYGKQAAQLKDYRAMLSPEEVEPWIGKLEQRRNDASASVAKRKEAHAALLAEIAAVPVSQQGLATLYQISGRTDPGAMSREEQESYNRAFQNKRQQIQRQTAAQQAQVKKEMVTLPAPMRKSVTTVLLGDSADRASLRGIRPGVSYNKIKSEAARLWGYDEAISLGSEDKQLTTKRREFDRLLREERRDGGLLNLRTRKGVVGELSYIEHFPGPADVQPLKEALEKRFGKPDDEKRNSDGVLSLVWHDGDSYLRVRAGDRVTPARSYMGVRSSVEITLWTQSFADYLAEADKRCQQLRNKPVSELSINEKQAIFTQCLTP
jgi:hypothetical protein